jgi:hypothetical protein
MPPDPRASRQRERCIVTRKAGGVGGRCPDHARHCLIGLRRDRAGAGAARSKPRGQRGTDRDRELASNTHQGCRPIASGSGWRRRFEIRRAAPACSRRLAITNERDARKEWSYHPKAPHLLRAFSYADSASRFPAMPASPKKARWSRPRCGGCTRFGNYRSRRQALARE